jgi:DNA-binding response OmpR family regulator
LKALLVDDNPLVLSALGSCLEFDGHTVLTAGGAQEALEHLQYHIPDLVLLDSHLATESESAFLLDIIRGRPALAQTRVVLLSGLDEKSIWLQRGADGFLCKPLECEELYAEIRRLGL